MNTRPSIISRSGHHHMRPMCHVAGFTLIELMLVVIIVGIFAALAVPYAGSASQSQLPAAMRILEADLAFVQAQAIAHQDDPCVIIFDIPNKQYTIAPKSSPTTPLTNPGDNQPYVVKYGKGRVASLPRISIKSTNVGDDKQLSFGSLGQLDQTTAASITLADGASEMTITLDPITGQATITRP